MLSYSPQAMASAEALKTVLGEGREPQPQQPALRLYEGEPQYYHSYARIFGWEGTDVRYHKVHGNVSPEGLAVTAIALPFNMLSKANAKRRAAPKWRVVETGNLITTDRRLIIGAGHSLIDWYHSEVADVRLDDIGVYLAYHGHDAHIIDVSPAANPWFYVLMSYLGLNIRQAGL